MAHCSSSEEDDKDDEKDDEDQKDLDHQPAVGGDGLEIFQDLRVCGLHIELGVFNVGVDSGRGREEVHRGRTYLKNSLGKNVNTFYWYW